ncbi:hypothetical protein BaRGS_00018531 [Batillaria attramentaria]|uniref:Ergosterol biosynthetic protein 28 n=1 Tax=Batillaria attramentaria TaxID=370345 RepID=A0ABD0KSZ1_9CAEN
MASDSFPKYLRFLSCWIGFVALMALGNTLQCFVDHSFLTSRLYTRNPDKNVTGLTARLFGLWTLLAAALRFVCAVDINNKSIYHLTFFSFFLALGHFLTEMWPYETAHLTVGICAPLVVSSVSVIFMAIGYSYLGQETPAQPEQETPELARKAKCS